MNDRETRLRERIDVLRDERDEAQARADAHYAVARSLTQERLRLLAEIVKLQRRAGDAAPPPNDGLTHGTRSTYIGRKCRCDACRAANRDYQRERAARKAAA